MGMRCMIIVLVVVARTVVFMIIGIMRFLGLNFGLEILVAIARDKRIDDANVRKK